MFILCLSSKRGLPHIELQSSISKIQFDITIYVRFSCSDSFETYSQIVCHLKICEEICFQVFLYARILYSRIAEDPLSYFPFDSDRKEQKLNHRIFECSMLISCSNSSMNITFSIVTQQIMNKNINLLVLLYNPLCHCYKLACPLYFVGLCKTILCINCIGFQANRK